MIVAEVMIWIVAIAATACAAGSLTYLVALAIIERRLLRGLPAESPAGDVVALRRLSVADAAPSARAHG